jgi:hypothetical protein
MAKQNQQPNVYLPPAPASLYAPPALAPVNLGQPAQPNPYAPPPPVPVSLGQDRSITGMTFAQPAPTMRNLIIQK